MHRAFVYGSLKEGLGNHGLLAKSTLEGIDAIKGDFKMVSLGGFPGVLESIDYEEALITVESYRINDQTLASLDSLESEGDFYHRLPFTSEQGREGFMYILDDRYALIDYELAGNFKTDTGLTAYEW